MLKNLRSWMQAFDESFGYDPVGDLIKSKADMGKQIALLEARILDLEKLGT